MRTNTLAASDARFGITNISVTVHKTSHQAEAANPRQRISPNPVRLRPAGFGLTAFVRIAGSSWHGLAQSEFAKRHSSIDRDRACIRYGEYIEADLRNQIRFRELALALWCTLMLVLTNFYAILLRGLRRAGRKDRQLNGSENRRYPRAAMENRLLINGD